MRTNELPEKFVVIPIGIISSLYNWPITRLTSITKKRLFEIRETCEILKLDQELVDASSGSNDDQDNESKSEKSRLIHLTLNNIKEFRVDTYRYNLIYNALIFWVLLYGLVIITLTLLKSDYTFGASSFYRWWTFFDNWSAKMTPFSANRQSIFPKQEIKISIPVVKSFFEGNFILLSFFYLMNLMSRIIKVDEHAYSNGKAIGWKAKANFKIIAIITIGETFFCSFFEQRPPMHFGTNPIVRLIYFQQNNNFIFLFLIICILSSTIYPLAVILVKLPLMNFKLKILRKTIPHTSLNGFFDGKNASLKIKVNE